MRLNDPLVTSIEVDGIELPIDLTFDNVLDVFDILEDSDLFPEEKVNMCLELLISDFEKILQGSSEQQFLLFNYILPVVLVNFNILKNISKFLQNVVVLDLIEHCKPVICFQIYSLAL